jgi:hypothetical protein
MDDLIKMVVLIASLVGAGVGTYAGFSVISVWRKRSEAQWGAGALPSVELDAIHARLGAAETLERRVAELEERLDFTERLLSQQHQPEPLSGGPTTGQH